MAAHPPASGRGNGIRVCLLASCPRLAAARPLLHRLASLFIIVILALALPATAAPNPPANDVSVDVSGGYARLVFKLSDDINAVVRAAGNVLIVSFDRPVAVSLDRLPAQAPDYIGAARRDPDGRAVRIALERKVTVNSMTAAGKLFVDLLPDDWSGPPPGLPQDVVEELARRAREAERLEKLAHQADE